MLRNALFFLACATAIAQSQVPNTAPYFPPVPIYIPPPMPQIRMPEYKPIHIPVQPLQLDRKIPTIPVITPTAILPVAAAGPSTDGSVNCEAEAAEVERAEGDIRRAESDLQNLQFQYQNAVQQAQQAELTASSLAWIPPGAKGGWAWLIAGGSILSSFNAMQLRSQAQTLEFQVNNSQFQLDMAQSHLSTLRASASPDCALDPLSTEALTALKNLGTQCFEGGELKTLLSAVRPNASGEIENQHARPAFPNGNPLIARPPITAATSIRAIARLADVEAALYRPDKQDLVLIGLAANETNGLLPDDWLVAYRSVLGTEPLGVSIDPGPDSREMHVRYLGGSQGTHLGTTLFEADRILKILSSGYDNFSCSVWPSMPASFATELDLIEADLRAGLALYDGGWHRFWFEPAEVPIEMTTDGYGVVIPKNRWIVHEQSIPAGRPSPPSARGFAENLSGKFLEMRAGIPAFAELHRVASLVYIAKWVRDQKLPGEALWREKSIGEVPTPLTTPSIAVLKGTVNGRSFMRYGIQGGVDFYQPNRYANASPMSVALLHRAAQAEISRALSWTFGVGGIRYVAVRLKYDRPISMGSEWVRSPRSDSVMEQPRVEKTQLPGRRIEIKNETGGGIQLVFSGPINMSREVSGNETASVELIPGVYSLNVKAECGTRTSSIDITDHVSKQLRYSCQSLVRPQ